jgi:hypothetical protein
MPIKSKSKEEALPRPLDNDMQINYKDVAAFLVFVAIVLLAYYVAVSLR